MGSEIDAPKLENSSTVVGHPLRHPPKHPVENLVGEVNRFLDCLAASVDKVTAFRRSLYVLDFN